MTPDVPQPWSWTAAPWWRARMLLRDLARIARGGATVVGIALRGPHDAPCIALLEGSSSVRLRTTCRYRIRLHNPGRSPSTLDVRIRGDGMGAPFELRAAVTLDPGRAADRWIITAWDGAAALDPTALPGAFALTTGPAIGRWSVQAGLEGRTDDLHIEGSFAE